MSPRSEIICSSPPHLCSNQERKEDLKPNSTFFIAMSLGLDQVISITALIHSTTRGVQAGILKPKFPPITPNPPSVTASSLCLFCPDSLAVTPARRQTGRSSEKSPDDLGCPCNPVVSSRFTSWPRCQAIRPLHLDPSATTSAQFTGSLGRVSRGPGAQRGTLTRSASLQTGTWTRSGETPTSL